MTPPVPSDTPRGSGRFMSAVGDLNHHLAHHKYDVSPDEIEGRVQDANETSGLHPFVEDPKDLVTKLFNDPLTQSKWKGLLDNDFCKNMKTIKKGATGYEDMVKKFKWYMIQDFFYCRELMLYDTERSTQAKDQKTYLELAKKIEKHAGEYGAPSSLKYCTENLGIKEDEVFKTGVADAITNYINFLQKTAQENNWVAAHVAMIPCVQSYFYIAADIAADRSVDRETVWYTNWVEPNTAYASSVRNQIELFKTNFALWEKNYDNLVKIFNEACGHEMAIWDAASKHT